MSGCRFPPDDRFFFWELGPRFWVSERCRRVRGWSTQVCALPEHHHHPCTQHGASGMRASTRTQRSPTIRPHRRSHIVPQPHRPDSPPCFVRAPHSGPGCPACQHGRGRASRHDVADLGLPVPCGHSAPNAPRRPASPNMLPQRAAGMTLLAEGCWKDLRVHSGPLARAEDVQPARMDPLRPAGHPRPTSGPPHAHLLPPPLC